MEATLVLLSAVLMVEGNIMEGREPQCYSRFDYEYKVLQNLVSLKRAEEELRQTIAEVQTTVREIQRNIKGKICVVIKTNVCVCVCVCV